MSTATIKRETLKCPSCGLNQFVNVAETCKRCKRLMRLPVALEVVQPERGPIVIKARAALDPEQSLHIKRSIADELKRARKSSGHSQPELAELMRCPRTYISKIENSRAQPTIVSLISFASALGIPAWQLLKNAEEAMKGGNDEA